MPIKWTPETDQILLLKLLETSGVTANYKAIAEAWPKDQQAPTARAISEHLIKIRNSAIKSGAGHFSIPSGQTPSPKSTPRKAKAANISAKGAIKKETNGVKKSRATKAKSKRMISVSSSPSPSPTSSPIKTAHTPNTLNSPSSSSEYSPSNQLKREVSIKAEFPTNDDNDNNEMDDRASPDTMEYVNDEDSGLGMGEI